MNHETNQNHWFSAIWRTWARYVYSVPHDPKLLHEKIQLLVLVRFDVAESFGRDKNKPQSELSLIPGGTKLNSVVKFNVQITF